MIRRSPAAVGAGCLLAFAPTRTTKTALVGGLWYSM